MLVSAATMAAGPTFDASAATPGSGQGRSATSFVLSGRLTGAPPGRKGSRRIAAIRVVRVETGEIAAIKQLSRSLKYRVAVPAGAYVVFGFVADVPGRKRYAAVSHVVRAKARGHRRLNLHVRRSRLGAKSSSAAPSIARAASSIRYVGVAPKMVVTGSQVPRGAIDQMLNTGLSGQPCQGEPPVQLLEIEHRAELLKEIKRSQSPGFDPATRMTNRLISPGYMVRGGGSQTGGTLQMELHMVDLKTGKTVASSSVSGTPDSFFDLYDQLQRGFIESLCREDRLPYHYKVLDASFQTHATGSMTGDICSLAGLPSGGTRDFSGTMATQPLPPPSKLEQLPASQDIDGSIRATTAAGWTNDHLNGCTFGEELVPCQVNTPDRSPQPGGTWEIVYGLDVQPQTQTITGHWSIPAADVGFVSGGVDPNCMFTPYIAGELSWDETAQSQPFSTFTAVGPQTISFSGARHFTVSNFAGGSELDYTWNFSITFERVDANGNAL